MSLHRIIRCGLAMVFVTALHAQNIALDGRTGRTAPPMKLSPTEVEDVVAQTPVFRATRGREAERVAAKLDRHVRELLEGAPWMPFHHTLGISGYEVYFNHPAELFYSLSIALPLLPPDTANRVKKFLADQLERWPPYAEEGFDHKLGNPREAYDVPMALRVGGRGRATSAFGVYAFWAYCHYALEDSAPAGHWTAIKARMGPLLAGDYAFEVTRKDYRKDEAEKLNGDLAGLIGMLRLARLYGEKEVESDILSKLTKLLELRVNLERQNSQILEPTESTTKHLHAHKLARYGQLTPEAGAAIRRFTESCGDTNLRAFREARNGWHLAFGDRFIGGENYTNPLHFSKALFDGAVWIEALPAEQILSFVDVPWCKADWYFIQKCVYALWAAGGRAFSSDNESARDNSRTEPNTQTIPLFNGKDLTGLYTWLVDAKYEDPRGVFSVTDGMLRISGDGLGYIGTTISYSNYHLVVEFKWGHHNWAWGDRIGKARDSGIFLHSIGPDGNSHDGQGAFKAAIECNLFQGATGDFLLIRGNAADGSLLAPRLTVEVAEERDADGWPFWKKGGTPLTLERWGRVNWFNKDRQWQDRLDFRGAKDIEKATGDWNRVECICQGDRIQIRLNGVVVNEATNVWPDTGPILLQCEGSEIFVRKFELRLLR